MKANLNVRSSIKILIVNFLLILFFQFPGCWLYVSEDELNELNTFKKEVYSLEAEVKDLKFKQLELTKERNELIKKLNDCQKFRDSLSQTKREAE
jgi:cell shape-determining protein MreC